MFVLREKNATRTRHMPILNLLRLLYITSNLDIYTLHEPPPVRHQPVNETCHPGGSMFIMTNG